MAGKQVAHTISFKRQVIAYMNEGHTAYNAAKQFSDRDKVDYDPYMFHQWYKKKNAERALKKCLSGGGRKPVLCDIEDLLADEIIKLRLLKMKVTRTFICDHARQMAQDYDMTLTATGRWCTLFHFHYDELQT
jgi:hypothetical protein